MFQLSIRGILGRKRGTALTLAVLMISFLFVTLCSIVASSVRTDRQLARERMYGRYQLLYDGNLDTAELLCTRFSGTALSMLAGETVDGQMIGSISESYQSLANLTITDGRLPQNEHEILLVGDSWGAAVGDEIQIAYAYSYARDSAEADATQELRTYLLAGLNQDRAHYLSEIAPQWDSYIQTPRAAQELDAALLHPLDELTQAQQDEAFLRFVRMLPDFKMSGGTSKQVNARDYSGFNAHMELVGNHSYLEGVAFGAHQGDRFESGPYLSAVKLYTRYTVCGIAEDYANHWDVGGLNMPAAFITESDCRALYQALSQLELDRPEVRPLTRQAIMLCCQAGDDLQSTLAPVLEAYNAAYNAAYLLEGVSNENGRMKAYLTGLDPETGRRVTYDVQGSGQSGSVHIGNARLYFSVQELSDSSFRLDGLDPIPLEPVTLDALYQNNTGALRANPLSYPPAGDTTQGMERLLSGVLIGMSACASFQLYLQSMRRQKRKLDTLIALGATDGQIIQMQLIEVTVFLLLAALAGGLLGFAAAHALLPALMGLSVSADAGKLCTGLLCNAAAILIGAMLPVCRIMLEYRRAGRAARTLRLRAASKHAPHLRGYFGVWLRHCAANSRQTLLRAVVVLLLAAVTLVPLFLSHRAYSDYYETVVNPDRPDYALELPYAASPRYLREICGQIDFSSGQQQAYVSAENVLLHCDELLASSPLLQALRQDTREDGLFEQLPDSNALCMNVRVIGADWDSELVQRVLRELPYEIDRAAFESGESCIMLLPRYREENGGPLLRQITPDAALAVKEDLRAGALTELSYLPQYADVYVQDAALSDAATLTLSARAQVMAGGGSPYLEEKLYTTQTAVAGVVSSLSDGAWPVSDTNGSGGITLLSGTAMVSRVYPNAATRMSAEQAKYFRVASALFYPDCYGKTYLHFWAGDNVADTAAYEKQVLDFAAKYGFNVTRYAPENQKLLSNAQSASATYLMMGINMLLVALILLINLLNAEVEEDRRRLGILQTIGMTDGQYVGGQSVQMLLMGMAACLLLHLLFLLVICTGLLLTGGGISMLWCRLRLLMQYYPWRAHGLLCLLQLVLLQLAQLPSAHAVTHRPPADHL